MVHTTLQHRAKSADGSRLLLWAPFMAATALIVGLVQTGIGHSFMEKIGLLGTPVSYTSLSFTDPQSLPAQLSVASTKMRMSFDLANTSSAAQNYHWSIMLERAGRDNRLTAGEINVPAGSRMTVSRTVRVSCAKGRVRMMVKVAIPDESIDFWMTCSSRKGRTP